jgi:hypothetical protein
MNKDLLSLILSLFALFMVMYIFINFNYYKNTPNFKIDETTLLSNSTTVCRDIDNKFDCQPILTQNKMIKYNDYKNNVYLSQNALICKDVDDISTCTCLKKSCNYFKNIFEPTQHVVLINDNYTFSPTNNIYYTGRILPIPAFAGKGPDNLKPSNTFSLSFFINIQKVDFTEPRVLINWDIFRLSIMPYKSKCSTKLYLQLFSLYNDGIFSDSCISDMTYYKWNHFVIQGSGNTIQYYFNGQPSNTFNLYKNFNLGNIDTYFIIGNNCLGISVSNMYWFNDLLTPDQINYLLLEKN